MSHSNLIDTNHNDYWRIPSDDKKNKNIQMKEEVKNFSVPPNSVYVWRGFRNPVKTYEQFADFLGHIFVPACALLQPTVGLRAYFTNLIPQTDKPDSIPDQTALMFWATPQSHDLANTTVAVRIYQNLHGDLYDMTRSRTPEIPMVFPTVKNDFTVEQPYYLFEQSADWMEGQVEHVIGARPANKSSADFIESVYKWAADFKINSPNGVDGALICCGNDYALAWVHASASARDFPSTLSGFAALIQVQLDVLPRSAYLPAGLWDKWAGLDLTLPENTSLNIQFKRKHETDPIEI